MKKTIKILHKTKKKVSFLLLLIFAFHTIILALPQNECNGISNIANITDENDCSIEDEMKCCDLMKADVNTNSFFSESTITQNSCDYNYSIHEHSESIIPKINNYNLDLNEISILKIDDKIKTFKVFLFTNNNIFVNSPPIYLQVSSFII